MFIAIAIYEKISTVRCMAFLSHVLQSSEAPNLSPYICTSQAIARLCWAMKRIYSRKLYIPDGCFKWMLKHIGVHECTLISSSCKDVRRRAVSLEIFLTVLCGPRLCGLQKESVKAGYSNRYSTALRRNYNRKWITIRPVNSR